MTISGLHHYTLQCRPDELPVLRDFYAEVIGLTPGDRPVMPAPGCWMYCEGRPIVHLYAGLAEKAAGSTGSLDHISFRASGLAETRARLRSQGIEFSEAPVEGWPLHQVFLKDPCGLKIEMTFEGVPQPEAAHG